MLGLYNQTADPSLDWIGRALASMIATRAATDPKSFFFEAANEREAWLARATHTIEGTYSVLGDKLRVVAYLRNGVSNERVLTAVSSLAEAPGALGKALAGQLADKVGSFDTDNREALRLFFTGSGSTELAKVLESTEAAVRADPKFGKAQVVRVEALLAAGRREEALASVIEARKSNLSAIDRTRLELIEANLAGDAIAQSKAVQRLASLTGDVVLWKSVVESKLVVKDFKGAASALESGLALNSEDLQLWNQLIYARGFDRDMAGAEKAAAEYRRLAPDDANALDSLGEVYFVNGRYSDAERLFLEAFEKNKALLNGGEAYRAAWSALLRGDMAKADSHFAAFQEYRKAANDPLLQVRKAVWLYQSGRSKEAFSALKILTAAGGTPGAAAASQLAAILATSGKLGEAQAVLAKPASSSDPMVAAAVGSPTMPIGSAKASAWWLLVRGKHKEAAVVWGKLYGSTNGSSASETRVALAWTLLEVGEKDRAKALLTLSPEPPIAPDPGLNSTTLPKWRELRARIL